MMERKVNIERFSHGARRSRATMRVCPHCGGNVRLVKDIYGAYHQCLQCTREIEPAQLAAQTSPTPAAIPAERQRDELLIA